LRARLGLQVKRMLGRLASLAVKMDKKVCAIMDMPITFLGCGSEEINIIKQIHMRYRNRKDRANAFREFATRDFEL
jgi:hypothetical protein